MSEISTTKQKVDQNKFASGWAAIWGDDKPADSKYEDICDICGGDVIDGICQKQLRLQRDRT